MLTGCGPESLVDSQSTDSSDTGVSTTVQPWGNVNSSCLDEARKIVSTASKLFCAEASDRGCEEGECTAVCESPAPLTDLAYDHLKFLVQESSTMDVHEAAFHAIDPNGDEAAALREGENGLVIPDGSTMLNISFPEVPGVSFYNVYGVNVETDLEGAVHCLSSSAVFVCDQISTQGNLDTCAQKTGFENFLVVRGVN